MRISLNKILQLLNWGSIITIWVLFYTLGGNNYINQNTVFLCTILSIQAHLFLIYSAKKSNPLLFILSFQLVIYYILRITTLLFTSYSVVFLRLKIINFSDSNYALIFIIISNVFLFLGIHTARKSKKTNFEITFDPTKTKNNRLILIILFTYFLSFSDVLKIEAITKLAGYIQSVFLNPYTILFMCIVYFVYNYNNFTKKIRISIVILILLFVIIVSLNGSRSGILTITVFFIIANIVIYDKISFRIAQIIGLAVFVPIAFIFFIVSSYVRSASIGNLSYSAKIEFAKSYNIDVIQDNKTVFAPVFNRIGFFDYATEIIAHKQQYSDIFKPGYYIASIIDNVLTPGFNIFDTPKVSNALIYKYSNIGQPSLVNVSKYYQSDQLTIYGEYYSLFFGYGSIVIFFFTGFLFQKVYNQKERLVGAGGAIQKGFVLMVFYTLINSFGLDWLLFDIIGIFVCYIIFKKFILNKENGC